VARGPARPHTHTCTFWGLTMAIQVIAHRGASAARPENTLAAFEEALRQGCDAIELDLQLSLDGIPVAYHDKNLVRLGLPDTQVADLTLAELGNLRWVAGAGGAEPGKISTLDEVLRAFGSRTRLLLEVKTREHDARGRDRHAELMEKTIRAVQALALDPTVSILSFDLDLLRLSEHLAPHLPRVLNLREPLPPDKYFREAVDRVAALSASVHTLTTGFGDQVQQANRPLLVFTCNNQTQLDLALRSHASGIMSDEPGWLRRCLQTDGCLS